MTALIIIGLYFIGFIIAFNIAIFHIKRGKNNEQPLIAAVFSWITVLLWITPHILDFLQGAILGLSFALSFVFDVISEPFNWLYRKLFIKGSLTKEQLEMVRLLKLTKDWLSKCPHSGLCFMMLELYFRQKIDLDEYTLLREYVDKHGRPKWYSKRYDYFAETGFYWEKYNDTPRHEWLDKHIKSPKKI